MDESTIDFNDFYYAYRFNDDNYKLLPKYYIENIIPLSKDESEELWQKKIDMRAIHYKECIGIRSRLKMINNNCGWGDDVKEKDTKKMLEKMANDDDEILFFWSKHYSVKTVWKIFCEYWSDFCYPSDDGNLILYKNDIALNR